MEIAKTQILKKMCRWPVLKLNTTDQEQEDLDGAMWEKYNFQVGKTLNELKQLSLRSPK